MLCILTSKWVLRTLLAGQNHFFVVLNVFPSFASHTKKEEKDAKKLRENTRKKGVYQCLGATLKRLLTPKHWSTPGKKEEKHGKMQKNMILTSEQCAKHLFAGRNTQNQ